MRVLVTGTTGFIGAALAGALARAGHAVVAAQRRAEPGTNAIAVEFARDHDEEVWRPRLLGVDAVVNTVGVFREHGSQSFEALHVAAPRALFAACAAAGIARVVQVSALGADEAATSPFHRSKKRADDALLERVPTGTIVQPSLVFGLNGASTGLFLALAALPVVALPLGGRPCVQPVHVDDVCALIVALLERDAASRPRRVAAVGAQPLALRDYLAALRAQLGSGRQLVLALPDALLRALAALRVPWVDRDARAMLARGNCADAAPMTALLGRSPRAPHAFVSAAERPAARAIAATRLYAPLVKASVAFVWLASGIVSLGLHPLAESYAWLARAGVPDALAPAALAGAAVLDVAFAVLMYVLRGRALRFLYAVQIATVLVYTAILSVAIPEFWTHPFGPLTKNVPFVVALAWLRAVER